jgi:hypothetical protein
MRLIRGRYAIHRSAHMTLHESCHLHSVPPTTYFQCIRSVEQIMLELEEEVVLVVLALQKRRKCRSRRVWVHPIVSARLTHGSFYKNN